LFRVLYIGLDAEKVRLLARGTDDLQQCESEPLEPSEIYYNSGMATEIFTFTRADIRAYGTKHQYAQMMFCGAGDDYAAARCLSLNLLMLSGFPLLSQSVEKLLKAIIFLETGAKSNLKGGDRHNPYALKEELQATVDYGLDRYDAALQKLFGHFQHRYFDNKNQSNGMNSLELDRFDELWVHLYEKIPFPLEVKYRLKFTCMLFDESAFRPGPAASYRYWVVERNKALAGKLEQMADTYRAVLQHYVNSPN
jgi:hypothetical protein